MKIAKSEENKQMSNEPHAKEFVGTYAVGNVALEDTNNPLALQNFVNDKIIDQLGRSILAHFGKQSTEDVENNLTIYTTSVVAMTREDFERYQDLENENKDLRMELDQLTDESVIEDE